MKPPVMNSQNMTHSICDKSEGSSVIFLEEWEHHKFLTLFAHFIQQAIQKAQKEYEAAHDADIYDNLQQNVQYGH